MIKYWPNKQSIDLNHAVVNLFITTKKKFIYNLSNNSNYHLYIDVLNNIHKEKLFKITLNELKKLILDIIQLNPNKKQLKKLSYQILCNITTKISKNFLYSTNQANYIYIFNINEKYIYQTYNNLIAEKNHLLINNLLIYLIFGSSFIDEKLFIFNKLYTPHKHVQILFENFIIQISNLTVYYLFHKSLSLSQIINFIQNNQLSNYSYISTRSIILFLNNLNWQNLIYKYINQPKEIYSSRYPVWLISTEGIIIKYIYTYRLEDIQKIGNTKTFFLCCLEIKDILIPKIEKIIIIIGKYFLYILINLFGNIIILMIRVVISYLQK
uniref:Ycf55 n=1 Tax=Acrosorium ciliolatum TaxID=1550622 RepID=A0A1Z1M1Z0_9FLOR|nr:hypothetical protein [Acrosorium ciliolatum]ARW59912.1 hypothetical protein [Acrosorium ciliolatum]